MENESWAGGTEIEAPAPEPEERECDGRDCLNIFLPTWHTQRRCESCRKENRPYKTAGSPF